VPRETLRVCLVSIPLPLPCSTRGRAEIKIPYLRSRGSTFLPRSHYIWSVWGGQVPLVSPVRHSWRSKVHWLFRFGGFHGSWGAVTLGRACGRTLTHL
jgi:hypothetical protein